MNEATETAELEPVWGAKAIGEVINRNEDQTLRLLYSGALPARKVGKLWFSERGALRSFVKSLSEPAMAA